MTTNYHSHYLYYTRHILLTGYHVVKSKKKLTTALNPNAFIQ